MKYTFITTKGEKMTEQCKELGEQGRIRMRDAIIGCGTDHFTTGEYVEIDDVIFES